MLQESGSFGEGGGKQIQYERCEKHCCMTSDLSKPGKRAGNQYLIRVTCDYFRYLHFELYQSGLRRFLEIN